MSAARTRQASKRNEQPSRGRADLARLQLIDDAEIARTAPAELRDLPDDFWADAEVVVPGAKTAISLRVDSDVLEWFRNQGPRYQTRMNAVLRSYMTQAPKLPGGTARRGRKGVA